MRLSKRIIFLSLSGALIAVAWIALRPASQTSKPAVALTTPTAAAPRLTSPEKLPEPPALPPAPPVNPVEAAATSRMVEAHSPLRIPEIADPDSGSNRQILQTMVQKALQRNAPNSHLTTAP
jgi:hypothetical protein